MQFCRRNTALNAYFLENNDICFFHKNSDEQNGKYIYSSLNFKKLSSDINLKQYVMFITFTLTEQKYFVNKKLKNKNA